MARDARFPLRSSDCAGSSCGMNQAYELWARSGSLFGSKKEGHTSGDVRSPEDLHRAKMAQGTADGSGANSANQNLAENSMRPIALGRKNWLHVGSAR